MVRLRFNFCGYQNPKNPIAVKIERLSFEDSIEKIQVIEIIFNFLTRDFKFSNLTFIFRLSQCITLCFPIWAEYSPFLEVISRYSFAEGPVQLQPWGAGILSIATRKSFLVFWGSFFLSFTFISTIWHFFKCATAPLYFTGPS